MLELLSDLGGAFNLFSYWEFRALGAFLFSFFFSLLLFPFFIRFLKKHKFYSEYRLAPYTKKSELYLNKENTPIMGGALMVDLCCISTIIWAKGTLVYICLICFVLFALLGLIDDFLKVLKPIYSKKGKSLIFELQTKDEKKKIIGLSIKFRLLSQLLISIGFLFSLSFFVNNTGGASLQSLWLPFIKSVVFTLPIFIAFLWNSLVIMGSVNATNFTDGLDGLAAGILAIIILTLSVFVYFLGDAYFSSYLYFPFIAGAKELLIFLSSSLGVILGFLWYNIYPARIFMGDTGSVAFGSLIGMIAVILRQELIFILISGVIVLEGLSVILQIFYFKLTGGKRLFLMAPIHHHFQKKGWNEAEIVIRFWLLGILFAVFSLLLLKIR